MYHVCSSSEGACSGFYNLCMAKLGLKGSSLWHVLAMVIKGMWLALGGVGGGVAEGLWSNLKDFMVCESAALLLLCVHVWIWPDGCRGMKSCVQQLVFLASWLRYWQTFATQRSE